MPIKLHNSLKCNISRKKWIIEVKTSNSSASYTIILNLRNMSKVPKIRSLHVFAISPEKHGRMKLIFCQQINTKVFYKMILSLWVCDASHVQSTQNKKTEILCNISRKTWRMKLVFCRQINVKCFFKLILSA